MRPGYVTISVDDGHPADLRTAELLDRHGLEATFYVPARNPERELLSEHDVRLLAQRFELGAHTYSHLPLARMAREQARREILDGKAWLEDVTGKPAIAFCYPRGKFTAETARLVEEAGFLGGRTCFHNIVDFPRNRFAWGVSTQAFSHSRTIQVRHALLERNGRGLLNYVAVHRLARDWEAHFGYALDYVGRRGGIAHLYVHSWETDELGEWPKLDRALARVAGSGLEPATNGELFARWGRG